MNTQFDHATVEARTQEIARELHRAWQAQRLSRAERVQDQVFAILAHDTPLREPIVSFVKEAGKLPPGAGNRELHRLAEVHLEPVSTGLMTLIRRAVTGYIVPTSPGQSQVGQEEFGETDTERKGGPGPPAHRRSAFFSGGIVAGRYLLAPFAAIARLSLRAASKQLVVPEHPRALERVLGALEREGRYASFDVPVEAADSPERADQYRDAYLRLIRSLAAKGRLAPRTIGGMHRYQVSIKLSALTHDLSRATSPSVRSRLMDSLIEIGVAARQAGISLTWDSEEYRYRALTWNLFVSAYGESELADWDGAGMVLQAYHRDAETFGAEVAAFARKRNAPFQVRLVKGAYWDAENEHATRACTDSPVFQLKHETDCSYEQLTCTLLQAAPHVRLALAGHNIRSHAHGEALREHLALAAGSIEHQTLFGMAPAISRAIHAMGWPARDYVPIGDVLLAMAYYSRRLVENASQVGFLMHLRDGTSIEDLLQPPCHRPGMGDRGGRSTR